MSDNTKLVAEKRTDFGKGAARKIRRAGNIPAVMYGHGTEPVHISLPGHDTMMALKQANALLTIVIDGDEQLALAKDVQRDAIKPVIDHVDLVVVRKGEKVTVDVAVHLEGEAAPETVVTLDHNTLQVEALATNIPENVVVSVEGLEAGTQILAGAVELPEGATLVTDAGGPRRQRHAGHLRRGPRGRARRGRGRGRHRARGVRRGGRRGRRRGCRGRRRRGRRGRGRPGLSHTPWRDSRATRCVHGSRPSSGSAGPVPAPAPTTQPTTDRGPHGHLARRRARQPRPGYAGNRHNVGAMAVEELAAP